GGSAGPRKTPPRRRPPLASGIGSHEQRKTPAMHVEPFRIAVPDAVLADLRERLARTRLPDEMPDSGWTYGTNLAYLRDLVAYWRDRYDWRAAEARLNAFPQFRATVDGLGIHF